MLRRATGPTRDAVEVVASDRRRRRPRLGRPVRRRRTGARSRERAAGRRAGERRRRTASGRCIRPRRTPWPRRCWSCCGPRRGETRLGPLRRGRAVRRGAGRPDRGAGSTRGRVGAGRASRRPARSLADLPASRWSQAEVERALAGAGSPAPVDLVVLDPPRTGAGARVVRAIAAAAAAGGRLRRLRPGRARPRRADLPRARAGGWPSCAAFDCFPQTHHVECVALLTPVGESRVETACRRVKVP